MATQNYHTLKNIASIVPATPTDLGSSTNPYGNLFLQGNISLANTTTITSTNALVPKISSVSYPNNASAAGPAGGETLTINGSGFLAGATVYLANTLINTSTVANSNAITFTTPVKVDGNYSLVVVNSDGGTATFQPGVTYSDFPVFSTASGTLGTAWEGNSVSTSVSATSDSSVTFSVTSGALPGGLTLASNGAISGTLANSASGNTTYNFTVTASDQESQKTARNFSYTVTGDTITWSSPSNNSSYSYTTGTAISNVSLSATSGFGKTITYSANSLPTGLSISGSNISGTPTVVANTSSLISATTTTKTANIQLNFAVAAPTVSVNYLVVAGGGGGGRDSGGGGGAGGYLTASNVSVTGGSAITITIGAGGTGDAGALATNGGNSVFGSYSTAIGGGAGATNGTQGYAGGSSGGGGNESGTNASGVLGQGNTGGLGEYGNGGGGGGGAGENGYAYRAATNGSKGGDGLQSSITGAATYYAGGGGGARRFITGNPVGGLGGGGNGGQGDSGSKPGFPGTSNTGGGGGGAAATGGSGGSGGSGVVILRFLSSVATPSTTGSPTITTDGSYKVYKFTSSGSITF